MTKRVCLLAAGVETGKRPPSRTARLPSLLDIQPTRVRFIFHTPNSTAAAAVDLVKPSSASARARAGREGRCAAAAEAAAEATAIAGAGLSGGCWACPSRSSPSSSPSSAPSSGSSGCRSPASARAACA